MAGGVGAGVSSGMRLSDIAEFIFTKASADGRTKTIRWLQARSLLASQMTCSCGRVMNLIQQDLQRSTTQDNKWALSIQVFEVFIADHDLKVKLCSVVIKVIAAVIFDVAWIRTGRSVPGVHG